MGRQPGVIARPLSLVSCRSSVVCRVVFSPSPPPHHCPWPGGRSSIAVAAKSGNISSQHWSFRVGLGGFAPPQQQKCVCVWEGGGIQPPRGHRSASRRFSDDDGSELSDREPLAPDNDELAPTRQQLEADKRAKKAMVRGLRDEGPGHLLEALRLLRAAGVDQVTTRHMLHGLISKSPSSPWASSGPRPQGPDKALRSRS